MNIPGKIINLIYASDAWIVGSAIDTPNPKDLDILVPYRNWQIATSFIPENAKMNSFGGVKFKFQDLEIDLFPGCLEDYIRNAPARAALHLKSGVKITKELITGTKNFAGMQPPIDAGIGSSMELIETAGPEQVSGGSPPRRRRGSLNWTLTGDS